MTPTRRSFLIASGVTALASTRVFGANDTIRLGVIGAGQRMKGLLDAAEKVGPYQIVAVSDVYGPHRDAVRDRSNGLATTHLDYREVHYCKILLDAIFGRTSFLNEVIWAYDYGGRTTRRWPPKHDNILVYVKNPQRYKFYRWNCGRDQRLQQLWGKDNKSS